MPDDSTAQASSHAAPFRTGLTSLAWGLVALVIMMMISRAAGFGYRREVALAVFFAVFILVNGYLSGTLRSRPAIVIGMAIVAALVAALSPLIAAGQQG